MSEMRLDEAFMIDSLLVAQTTLMRLIDTNARLMVYPAGRLSYALSACATTIRGLRVREKTVRDAVGVWCDVSAITQEADLVLAEATENERREQRIAQINDLMRDWYRQGWLFFDDGMLQLTSTGHEHFFAAAS